MSGLEAATMRAFLRLDASRTEVYVLAAAGLVLFFWTFDQASHAMSVTPNDPAFRNCVQAGSTKLHFKTEYFSGFLFFQGFGLLGLFIACLPPRARQWIMLSADESIPREHIYNSAFMILIFYLAEEEQIATALRAFRTGCHGV